MRDRKSMLLVSGLFLLTGVTVGLWGWKSVPDGAVGLRTSAIREERFLGPGTHWVVPGLETVAVLDPYVREADLAYATPEGALLDIRLKVALRLTLSGARALPAQVEGSGLLERLDRATDSIVTDAIRTASGTDSIPRLDERITAEVGRALERFGRLESDVVLAYDEDSPTTLAVLRYEAKRTIRDLRRQTDTPILIVGLDGADWQIAEPLIRRRLLPNLEALRKHGAWGNVKALTPILSPLLWTSVVTGVTPDRHGILDFLATDPTSGKKVPVNSRFRKVRALWNLFSDAGRTSDFVAWWATWPAETVNGHQISDRVAYSLFDVDLPEGGAGTTFPPSYYDRIRPQLVGDDAITYEEVARFVSIAREDFRHARDRLTEDRTSGYRDPINHLTKILAATRNYHRIALDLLDRGQADLTAVYYQGIDEVCHRFMHYAAPRLNGIDPEDVERYGLAVERFYVYQDRMLGELLEHVHPDTTVIVLSDHGFRNGADRPQGETADIEGEPGKWHRPYGVLVLAGPSILPGRLDTTSLLDITPTVLYLAGLPVPEDSDGRVLSEAIRPEFHESFPLVRIPTYEIVPFRVQAEVEGEGVAEIEAGLLENLRALGYVGGGRAPAPSAAPAAAVDAEAGIPAVTAHTNLATVLLSSGDLAGAEREILAALEIRPHFVVARRQLFTLRVEQERYAEALEMAANLLAEKKRLDDRFLARIADAYEAAGHSVEGTRVLASHVDAGSWWQGAALARLLLHTGDHARADAIARAVLAREPNNESAMVTVFRIARSRGQLSSLKPLLESALLRQPRSVMHLNWLAIVHESTGDMPKAEELLLRALEANPDHSGSMVNLGAFYSRHDRIDDAVRLLERALRIAPQDTDARINLGSTLARAGRMEEAVVEFERIVESGVERVDVFNALGRAQGQLGDLTSAARWFQRSIELDPEQEAVREALTRLEAR